MSANKIIECGERECIHRDDNGNCTLSKITLIYDGSPSLGRMVCKEAELKNDEK